VSTAHAPISRFSFITVKAAIFTLSFIGLCVVLSSHFRRINLLFQWDPSFRPVPYQAGWGFLICSLGLLSVLKKWRFLACASGLLLILSTSAAFILNLNGVHALGYFRPDHMVCSLTRVSGFLIAGGALVLLSLEPKRIRPLGLSGFLGLLIFLLGLLVAAGFVVATSSSVDAMSVQGAVCFFIFGAAIVDLSCPKKSLYAILDSYWFPVAIATSIFMFSVGLYFTLRDESRAAFARSMKTELNEATREISRRMDIRVEVIERFAHHWAVWGRPRRKVWESDALDYVKGHHGYQSVGWIDPSFHLRWLIPMEGNEASLNRDVRFEPRRKEAAEKALRENAITITRPLSLVEGGRGFRVVLPLRNDKTFDGFIVAAFRYKELFKSILAPNVARDCSAVVLDRGEVIYERNLESQKAVTKEWVQSGIASFTGGVWQIKVWPTSKMLATGLSLMPRGILIIGGLAALAAGLGTFLGQLFWRRRKDIEAKKNLEEQLLERARSESKLKSLLEATPDAMLIFDHQDVIVSANTQAERVLKCPRETLVGRSISGFLGAPSALRWPLQSVAMNAASGVMTSPDTPVARHDGSRFPAQVTCSYLDLEKETLGIAAIRDITDRKRQEEELARSNEELEQFAYVASHDLQEPLRIVVSYLDLLRKKYRPFLNKEAKEFIGFAVDGAHRMRQLIEDLLSLSRVGTVRSTTEERFSLLSVIEQAVQNLQVSVEDSGAQVTFDENLPELRGEAVQFVQLFQNLIGNAIKYRKEGVAPAIHISAKKELDRWALSVADNGIGFDMQFVDRIFVVFQRLHGRGAYSGNGVGLAICKRIVERHGGQIWAESKLGVGSTFHFTVS
jgi:PAS domain S-box-containing protein